MSRWGLGLTYTITAKLVDLMGGRIWIEDNLKGRGSVFHFTIRLRENNRNNDYARNDNPTEKSGRIEPNRTDLKGVRILLVEDDPDIHELVIRLVQRKDGVITTVNNGREASEMLNTETYDLIITDLNMPVMNGIEFMNAFKQRVRRSMWSDAPIIVLTGASEQVHVERCVQAGACKHLSKPFNPKQLYEAIFDVLRNE